MSARPPILPAVLAAAILGISISGPLARMANAEPLAIAFWRLALACGVIGAILIATGGWREWRTLSSRDVAIAGGAGVLLAIHFWSWIASLGMTSVAASVLLVNLHPVVIVAGSALFFGERPRGVQIVGIAVALLGAVIIALGGAEAPLVTSAATSAPAEISATSQNPARAPLLGEALALLGAITVGLYYLAGRSLRARLTLWPYVGIVYGACFVTLSILAAAQGTALWPFAPKEWMLFAGIALGPMLIGHTGFNWALRYVPAYVVSLALLAEPVGASLLAWLLPSIAEVPSVPVVIGGAAVLLGLALGTVSDR